MNAGRVAMVMTVALVTGCGLGGQGGDSEGLEASGTVEGTEAQLGFQTPGRIDSIFVREGDSAAAGTELARLDRSEQLARRRQAAAQVAAMRAQLAELERGARPEELEQARAARDAALERLEDARRDLDRTKRLFDGGAVSREVYDKAVAAFAIAGNQASQAEEQLKIVESGPRSERVAAQRAALAQAEAAQDGADAALKNLTLVAPFAGVVTVRHREPGEIVPAGSAVITLLNRGDRWVRIYVPQDRIGAVSVGSAASIISDTYPDKRYPGEVAFINSAAEFTPKNVQTAEERVKLVYAAKVRITDDPNYELKPGMPVEVRVTLRAK